MRRISSRSGCVFMIERCWFKKLKKRSVCEETGKLLFPLVLRIQVQQLGHTGFCGSWFSNLDTGCLLVLQTRIGLCAKAEFFLTNTVQA